LPGTPTPHMRSDITTRIHLRRGPSRLRLPCPTVLHKSLTHHGFWMRSQCHVRRPKAKRGSNVAGPGARTVSPKRHTGHGTSSRTLGRKRSPATYVSAALRETMHLFAMHAFICNHLPQSAGPLLLRRRRVPPTWRSRLALIKTFPALLDRTLPRVQTTQTTLIWQRQMNTTRVWE
jgi:hypothetical protein